MPKLRIHRGEALYSEVNLSDRDLRIGRGEQNDIRLEDPTKAVSRFHAELRCEDGEYQLRDLNSQNGLWAGGRRQAKITLEPDTPVTLGPYTLTLVSAPAAAADVPPIPVVVAGTLKTSDTLVQPAAADRVLPAAAPARSRAVAAALPSAPKAGKPPTSKSSLLKPLLFGGFAVLVVLAIVLGKVMSRDKPGGRSEKKEEAPVAAPAPSNDQLKRQHLADAKSLLERNDFDGALAAVEQVLVIEPNNQDALDIRVKAGELKAAAAVSVSGGSPQPPTGPASPGQTPPPPGVTPVPSPATPTPSGPTATAEKPTRPPKTAPPPGPTIPCRVGEKLVDCAARERDVAARYERAKNALDGGSFQAAAAQLGDLAHEEPNYKDVALLLSHAREGLHAAAQQALDAGTKAEGSGDWVVAVQQYQRAPQSDSSTSVVAEEGVRRVRARMKTEGTDAFTRAKQYDAIGRVTDAIAHYERALRFLPDDDANKKTARERLDALRLRQ